MWPDEPVPACNTSPLCATSAASRWSSCMIVILIIGLLAAIALPAFLNQRTKAQDAEAKSAVRNARTTLETYHTDRAHPTTRTRPR